MAKEPNDVTRFGESAHSLESPGTGHSVEPNDCENDEDRRSPDEIRAQIARTRAEMDRTVDEIQDRLMPSHLVHRLMDSAKGSAAHLAQRGWQTVKKNPLPCAVIGLGIGLLIYQRAKRPGAPQPPRDYATRDDSPYDDSDSAAPSVSGWERAKRKSTYALGGVKDKASALSHHAAQKVSTLGAVARKGAQRVSSRAAASVSDLGGYTKQKAASVGHQIQHGAGIAKDWFDDTMDDYPLAVGAAFFTAGLAGGLSVPATRPENKFLGPTRDRLLNQAQGASAELLARGEQLVERAAEAAEQAVSNRGSSGAATKSSTT